MTSNIPFITDHGAEPYALHVADAAKRNTNYRIVQWTGKHLQLTFMSLRPGEDIGLETHPHIDQFLRVESGRGLVRMGPAQNDLRFSAQIREGDAVLVPAGTWHNIINTGREPLKLSSLYGPPDHPQGEIDPVHPSTDAQSFAPRYRH